MVHSSSTASPQSDESKELWSQIWEGAITLARSRTSNSHEILILMLYWAEAWNLDWADALSIQNPDVAGFSWTWAWSLKVADYQPTFEPDFGGFSTDGSTDSKDQSSKIDVKTPTEDETKSQRIYFCRRVRHCKRSGVHQGTQGIMSAPRRSQRLRGGVKPNYLGIYHPVDRFIKRHRRSH